MGIEIAAFDLECTSLNADFGIVLCAVILPHGSNAKPKILRGDKLCKEWDTRRSDDRATVFAVADELSKYDLLIGHNAHKFDLPFLKTRLAKYGKTFPKVKLIDPVLLARRNFRMSYNSLDRITDFLGCNTKTSVQGELWLKASLDGDRKAMNYIVEHCVQDVLMLDRVLNAVKPYSTAFNSWGSEL